MKATMLKATKDTKHYRANQKLWVLQMSGSRSALVTGKHKGKGRYVDSWISWDKDEKPPKFQEIEVTQEFHESLRRDAAI